MMSPQKRSLTWSLTRKKEQEDGKQKSIREPSRDKERERKKEDKRKEKERKRRLNEESG